MTSPAPLVIPRGVQLTVRMTQSGQPCVVTLGGRKFLGSAMSQAQAESWLAAAWNLLLKPYMANTVSLAGGVVRHFDTDAVIELTGPATGRTGENAGDTAVAAGCTLIKWNTGQGGRSGKGRTFVPGLTAQQTLQGRSLVAGHITAVTTAITNYLAAPAVAQDGTGVVQPAVLSRQDATTYLITSGSVGATIGIQRRRMRA